MTESPLPERQPPSQAPVPERIRASDAERDAVVEVLSAAAGDGRLTLVELEQRISAAHEARTRAELVVLTEDLPGTSSTLPTTPATGHRRPPAHGPVTEWVVAVMSGSTKRGRWRPARHTRVVAVMGGDEIDLREAELDGDELTITAVHVMGGSEIYVPDRYDLQVTGVSVMGGNEEKGSLAPPQPGAARITLRIYNFMGGGTIWRLPPEADGLDLKAARKLAKRHR